ncbi:zf-HC2 domain-containing protein [bacterium]|nr:zf-HC2 domain-containing protein [bacterium]
MTRLLCKQIDGDITAEEQHHLDEHLTSCEQCAAAAESLRLMKKQLRQLPVVRVSDEFHIILRDRIRKSRIGYGAAKIEFPLLPRWTYIPAAGVALAVVALLLRPYLSQTDERPFSTRGTAVAEYLNDAAPEQVHYVIEDNPDSIMLSRDDSGRMRTDSTHTPRESAIGQRAGAVQVSF